MELDQNKTELFVYLSKEVLMYAEDDMVLTFAYDTTRIISTNQMVSSFIPPCNHEEADTRNNKHVNDMSVQGYPKIIICTMDTDRCVGASCFSVCMLERSVERIMGRFWRSLLNRVPCMLACQRGLRAKVLSFQHGLRAQHASMPTCRKRANFSFLHANVLIDVPTCHTLCQCFNLACQFFNLPCQHAKNCANFSNIPLTKC